MWRQIRPLSRNPDSDVEIVDDSEPERVQLRNRTPGNTFAPGMHRRRLNNAGLHTTATVIEISDSEPSSSSCGKNAIIYGSAPIAVKPVKDPQPGPSKSIDLKKFAFKPVSTKQQVLSVEPSIPLPQNKARPPEHRRAPKKVCMNLDFLLPDISRASRCVCCSISWTTRKTAAQKLDHIQRCAKKNGHDHETVRILIKNETASPKGSDTGHCRLPTSHSTSTTLLEDVMQPRSNKRKNVHPSNHISVGSPLRDAILTRAKGIIAGPSPDEASPQLGPHSQAFMASTLLQGSSKTWLFSATSQDDEYFPELRNEILDTMPPYADQPTLKPTTIGIGNPPTRSSKTIGGGIKQGDYRKDENHVDVRRDPLQVTTQKVPVQKVKKGKPQSSEKGIHGTPLDEDVVPAKHVLSKVRSSAKKKVTFGKEWEAFMKEHIREDNELNLRVIRYEPVDFSLFLKLAKAYAPSTAEGTLKSHLRHFLDNQAIHFYEANVWSR